ncbi:MAG: GAF domain-containing sensor histidine kinase [Caldilineaceae bacterium]
MKRKDEGELARRNRELLILNSIAQALHREIDLDRALHVVLAQVTELFSLRTGWIFLVHEETNETYLAASLNLPPGLTEHPALMAGDCYCLDTYQAGDLAGAANVNIITCTRLKKLVSGSGGLRFHASIPLYGQERKLGVLNVASADWRKLSDDDLQMLYTVGDLLSIAVERARLFARSTQIGALEERNRLAREIHDTLAQGLSAIALKLDAVDALLEYRPTADVPDVRLKENAHSVRQYVKQALMLAQQNLDEARRSVLDLRAAPLEGRTLAQALEVLAHSTAEHTAMQIDFASSGDRQPLPVRLEVGLYRIAQEALNNACRHADARQIHIALHYQPDGITLELCDDGRGFDVAEIEQERFGLVGMSERARLLGAQLRVESDVAQGTHVRVTAPLAGR